MLSTELKEKLRNHAKDAITVQNACNLGGVVHAFDRVVTTLQEASHVLGKGTEWVNRHPVVRLFLEQLVHLNCGCTVHEVDGMPQIATYSKASQWCAAVVVGDESELEDYAK